MTRRAAIGLTAVLATAAFLVMRWPFSDGTQADALPAACGGILGLKPGEVFELKLPARAAAGFLWKLEGSATAGSVDIAGARSVAADSVRPTGGSQAFRITAKEQGTSNVRFLLRRPFEPGEPPLSECRVTIEIK